MIPVRIPINTFEKINRKKEFEKNTIMLQSISIAELRTNLDLDLVKRDLLEGVKFSVSMGKNLL